MAKDHIEIDPIEALRNNASVPFNKARAMPPEVYTTDEFTRAELEHIFRREWYCVGRADSLCAPGDYATCELAGQPIVVLRDARGDLRAYSNVCLHRMSTMLQGTGNSRTIACPYHGWTYNLDGTLRGAPAMSLNNGFCRKNYRLPAIACEEWLGWIMITLNPEAEPVSKRLSEVESLIENYRMADYTQSFYEEHVWNTNWKVLAENFMESYHLPVCHAKTVGGLSKLDEMVCPPGLESFNYHTILKDDTLRIAMAHPDNARMKGDERRTTFLLAIYPSLLITLTPGYFWYLSLHPIGPDRVHIRYGGGMSNDFKSDVDTKQNFIDLKILLDEVNVEDRGCTEKVYKGLCSTLTRPGHLSHLERPNYDFARYLMSCLENA